MTAPWDRRSLREQARVEGLVLARWLPTVLSAAPLWARRVAADGLEARTLTDREGLRQLAPARAVDLLADGPGAPGAVVRPSESQVKAHADGAMLRRITGGIRRYGEAGKREVMLREFQPVDLRRAGPAGDVLVASSRSDLDRLHRAGARAARVLGLDDRDVLLDAVPTGPTMAATAMSHLAQGASITALHVRGHADDLTTVAGAAELLPATVLAVELDEAVALVRTLVEARVQLPRLRRVITYGPPPDEETRAMVAAELGAAGAQASVRALWGPALGRSMWAECAEGVHGLHTTPDLELLEVLEMDSGRVTEGDGDLTLTSIGWHGTALVRVRTGAWVDPPVTSPCPGCARTVPRLVGELVPGAWEVEVATDDSLRHHVDLRGVPAVLSNTDGVTAWRAELRGPDESVAGDRLVVEVAGELSRAERHGLEQRLQAACGLAPQLTLGVARGEVERAVTEVGGVFADVR